MRTPTFALAAIVLTGVLGLGGAALAGDPPPPAPAPAPAEPAAERGFVGIGFAPIALLDAANREELRAMGITATGGVVVTNVLPAGPAAKAGVAVGDVLVSFAGRDVKGLVPAVPPADEAAREAADKAFHEAFGKIAATVKPGADVEIVVERAGKTLTVRATAVDNATIEKIEAAAHPDGEVEEGGEKAPPAPPAEAARGYVGFSPLPAELLAPELREKFKIAPTARGIVAVQVIPGSPSAKAGLVNGDRVLRVADVEMPSTAALDPARPESAEELQKALQDATLKVIATLRVGREVEIVVEREGKPVTLKATPVDEAAMNALRKAAGIPDPRNPHDGDEDEDEDEEDGDAR